MAEKTTPRLKTKYTEEVRPALLKEFQHSNVMEVGRVVKVVVNMGVGEAAHDSKMIEGAVRDLAAIQGRELAAVGVRQNFAPVADVTIGSVFHVQPEGLLDEEHHVLDYKAKASVIVMRLDPKDIKSQKELDWGHEGIVAYSKICTHVGCPVGLYEQTTHHLLCPCHQSTFDVTDDCKVVFGPAKRPLPQLPITVDDEGYLIAEKPFQEPVGPSFWEREK